MLADIIVKILSFIHYITTVYDTIMRIVSKGYSAVVQSQIPDVWVFTHRNAMPWITKNMHSTSLSFYPETNKFYKNSFKETKKSMDDLVTAEILDASGILVSDVTEFLHTIRWGEMVPSVYEIILIFFLLRDVIISQDTLSSYVLRVMTIDTDILDIPLNDTKTKEEFSSWSVWLSPSPSSASSASSASDTQEVKI